MRRIAVLLAVAASLPAAVASSAGAAGCPNEALRTGPSALLPGCRAYEMVSPTVKNGGNVTSIFSPRAARSGEGVLFFSTAAFSGAPGSPLGNAYVARRGENWTTESVDTPQLNPGGLLLASAPASSPELDQTLEVSKVALTPGAIEGGSNVYVRDNLTGARRLVTAQEGNRLFQSAVGGGGGLFIDGSSDWSDVLLHASLPLKPEAPEGVENLYDFSGGQLHLVNFLPNGTVDPSGGHIATGVPYGHSVSDDGSRIFFETGEYGSEVLYVRENLTKSVPISVSQRSGEKGELEPGQFLAASADGNVVYFTSVVNLTDEPEAGGNLYRYDLATKELSNMTPGIAGGAGVGTVMAISEDGSYVYFTAIAALAPGATPADPNSDTNLYAWHEGQVKFIAQTTPENQESGSVRQAMASPDGAYLGFASYSPLTGNDPASPVACPNSPTANNVAGDCLDAYSFDYATGVLECVSCNGQPGRGDSNLGGQANHEVGLGNEYPRAVLDDGTVFFETPNRLLPRDVNGVGDVYAAHGPSRELISTGEDTQPSTFADATTNGQNVYVLTSQRLVKQDTDNSIDVYDDRELGGLATQSPSGTPAPCEGDACLGPAPSPPAPTPLGSARGGDSCAALNGAAGRAAGRARNLGHRARAAARGTGTRAKARAKRLRRQATTARRGAKQLRRQADTCGRTSR